MTGEPEQEFDPWDADIWTVEGLDVDMEEIARGEHDAGDEPDEDIEAYRERVLAPLRRLAERLRAEDESVEADPSGRMAESDGEADGQGDHR
jgi:hypothetical protein